ncbi:hypothetical protein HDV00_000148 [Rhizophlyctis rosea]|nr:hypothetical protein HDV00_000148 [Rhizophlyctis rosea]
MSSLRHNESGPPEKKRIKRKDKERAKEGRELKAKPQVVGDHFAPEVKEDDDIFADAGQDYKLEVNGRTIEPLRRVGDVKEEPFEQADKDKDGMDVDEAGSLQELLQRSAEILKTSDLAAKIVGGVDGNSDAQSSNILPEGPSTFHHPPPMDIDADVAGLDSGSGSESDTGDLSQMDLGVKANKRRQRSRFDFDDEEEWQKYKESQVHLPKAAFAFGMKAEDTLKRKSQKKDPKNKLNKEFQQLDKVYHEKYGKGLGDQGKRRGEGNGGGKGKKQKR